MTTCPPKEALMKRLSAFTVFAMLLSSTLGAQSGTMTVPATGGDITITAIQHATVQVEQAGKIVQIDPAQGDPSKAKPGDLVLVTDIHGDHLNPEFLAKVRKPGAPVVVPAAVQQQAGDKI